MTLSHGSVPAATVATLLTHTLRFMHGCTINAVFSSKVQEDFFLLAGV